MQLVDARKFSPFFGGSAIGGVLSILLGTAFGWLIARTRFTAKITAAWTLEAQRGLRDEPSSTDDAQAALVVRKGLSMPDQMCPNVPK